MCGIIGISGKEQVLVSRPMLVMLDIFTRPRAQTVRSMAVIMNETARTRAQHLAKVAAVGLVAVFPSATPELLRALMRSEVYHEKDDCALDTAPGRVGRWPQ